MLRIVFLKKILLCEHIWLILNFQKLLNKNKIHTVHCISWYLFTFDVTKCQFLNFVKSCDFSWFYFPCTGALTLGKKSRRVTMAIGPVSRKVKVLHMGILLHSGSASSLQTALALTEEVRGWLPHTGNVWWVHMAKTLDFTCTTCVFAYAICLSALYR